MSDTQKVLSEYLTMFLNHGTSLAFQWLRLWASNVGIKMPRAMWRGQKNKQPNMTLLII